MDAKQIAQFVESHKQEALDFLVEVVQTPSVTGNELQVSKVITKQIEKMGLQAEVHALDENRPNLIATWRGSEEGPCFIFNGHYDVFPPLQNAPGMFGPWSGKIKDGYIYGRGAVDMKGGLCAGIMAVSFLKKIGYIPQGSIILSCDSDEESGGKYGVEYLLEQGLLKGDFGVCMEPTHCKVMVEGSGGIFLEISYTSNSWHGGDHRNEKDALEKALEAISALKMYNEQLKQQTYYEPFQGSAFLSITMINAGEAMNTHPSSCTFIVDRRMIPGETAEQAENDIRQILDTLKTENNDMNYSMSLLTKMPALQVDPNCHLVKTALEAYETIYQKPGALFYHPWGTDSAKIVEKYGFPMPNFGPGMGIDETTAPDEKLLLQDYYNFIKIYMLMVINLIKDKDK